MKEIVTDVAIVGAGSAGLSAAYQAACAGADVLVIDENSRPGGQLFKQIHKFFGSKEHQAGTRGFVIGQQLLEKVEKSGAKVMLDSLVYGLLPDKSMGVISNGVNYSVKAKKIIIASGAKENYMAFPGSTLPGVMGAGAALSAHAGRCRSSRHCGGCTEDRRIRRSRRQDQKSGRADLCGPHHQTGIWKRRGRGRGDRSRG